MVRMQELGYRYAGEDRGVFGLSRTGGSGAQRAGSLALWPDCFCAFDRARIRDSGYKPEDVFFQGLAYRMMWYLRWDPVEDELIWGRGENGAAETPTEWELELLAVFNEVEPVMGQRQRTVLPDEAGVMYRADNTWVLWTFADDIELKFDEATEVSNLMTGDGEETAQLRPKARHVYTWEGPAPTLSVGEKDADVGV
jgi:hypothetical protein